MKVRLIKDWLKENGLTVPAEREIVVTQQLGKQLIRQKKAVELKDKDEKIINFTNNKTEVKTPLT